MLRLVHPPPDGGKATRPPRGRKGVLSITLGEHHNLRRAANNLRQRFGTWSCRAEGMDVPLPLKDASSARQGFGSYGLTLRAARAAEPTLATVLSSASGAQRRAAS